MKKVFVCFLMGLLLFAGCGKETEGVLQSSKEENVGRQEAENSVHTEPLKEVGKEEGLKEEEIPNVDLITLYKDYVAYEEWGKVGVICRAKGDIVRLFDEELEKYPKLENALEKENMATADLMMSFMTDNICYAREKDGNEYFYGYEDRLELSVQRADNLIVSVRQDQYQYTGAMRPLYASVGFNIDPCTGEKLTITDIVTDFSMLLDVLGKKLTDHYDEEMFYEPPTEILQTYTPDMFCWTMGYQGITFYFNAYELAPYAAGMQVVTVWFDEAEEWIDNKYMVSPKGGYVAELPMDKEIHVDLEEENQEKETLILSRNYVDEAGECYQIAVSVNDEYDYSEEIFYYGDIKTFLACVPEQERERFYLYVQYTIESTDLYVYELTKEGMEYKGRVQNVNMPGKVLDQWDSYNQTQMYLQQVLSDPSKITMTSRMYLMGFMDGVKTYRADPKDGIPKATEEYYVLPEDFATLTSVRDLELEILPEKTKEVVPAGTQFVYLRTDNENYIDFRLDDGRECRVRFEKIAEDATIAGYLPEDCFEGIPMYF